MEDWEKYYSEFKQRVLKDRFKIGTSLLVQLEDKMDQCSDKIKSLIWMEETGGAPDVVGYDNETQEFLIFDCSAESPSGRRSLCYDNEALEKRKANKPKGSAVQLAKEKNVEILSEEEYQWLQTVGDFDVKTSSWLKTPENIRKLGGAIFGDKRFDTTFIYHNGADSYYAARGFRAKLII